MTIQTNDVTGAVVLYPQAVPAPKPGHTIRQADAVPPRPGVLRWDDAAGQLVRAPLPPPPVPSLTARQLRLWLLAAGITPAAIDAQVDAMSDPAAQARARVEWEYATEYKHDHPLVLQIGAALGLSQVQIDAAFRAAAAL